MIRWHPLLLLAILSLSCCAVAADGLRFGIAGKSTSDTNFIRVWEGCKAEAQKYGDQCVFIGEAGPANFRAQDGAILNALNGKLDALAVSITNTEWLAKSSLDAATRSGVPIVTFDSDLDPPHQHLRKSYIGTNNHEFGRDLGLLLKRLRFHGGELCLMSGDVRDPNLNQRIEGVREVLDGNPARIPGTRLNGRNGWSETSRCPWFARDSQETAVRQIEFTLNELKSDAIVSVGHWPVIDPDFYLLAIGPLMHKHANKFLFVGIGAPLPAQLDLLKSRLISGMVAIDFEKTGRMAYSQMRKIVLGEAYETVVHLPSKTLTSHR